MQHCVALRSSTIVQSVEELELTLDELHQLGLYAQQPGYAPGPALPMQHSVAFKSSTAAQSIMSFVDA